MKHPKSIDVWHLPISLVMFVRRQCWEGPFTKAPIYGVASHEVSLPELPLNRKRWGAVLTAAHSESLDLVARGSSTAAFCRSLVPTAINGSLKLDFQRNNPLIPMVVAGTAQEIATAQSESRTR